MRSVMRAAGALPMTLALLQIGQVRRGSKETVAFVLVLAVEPIDHGVVGRSQQARYFGAAHAMRGLFNCVEVECSLVRSGGLDIATHKIRRGGTAFKSRDRRLAKRGIWAYDTVTFEVGGQAVLGRQL